MSVSVRSVAKHITLLPGECDVFTFCLDGASLALEIHPNTVGYKEKICITFTDYYSFFVTDEGDLVRYWGSGLLKNGGLVHEILEGGLLWQESQCPGLLAVTSAQCNVREWFIQTSGQCVTVISSGEPQIQMVKIGAEP